VAALGAAAPARSFLISSLGAPTARQVAEAGVDVATVQPLELPRLAAELDRGGFDAVVLALPGDTCQVALQLMARHTFGAVRPVVVAGWVGVILRGAIAGLAERVGADMILANSPHDADWFRGVLTALGRDPACLVETRLPFLAPREPRPADLPFTVVFAAQPGIPAGREDRLYLVRRLVAHARSHPDREVILKVRGLPGERLTHVEPHPYHRLARDAGADQTPNFKVVAGPMREMLARADLLLTVSSTAAVEAIHAGIPTGILADFGLVENTGVAFYIDSGCVVSMDQIDAGASPAARPEWRVAQGLAPDAPPPPPSLADRLAALVAADRGPIEPLYNESFAPAYLRGLARRSRAPGAGRRVLRRAARVAYRAGVDRVAPALRSLTGW
jgi:hypothetical protein